MEDTIVALSSPIGEAGVCVIRISGSKTKKAFLKLSRSNKPIITRKATNLSLYGEKNQIDSVIYIFFESPSSYTGEDVLEIHSHGGNLIPSLILKETLKYVDRIADPGEFTKRAFLNGKINLQQSESVIDLIHSKSEQELIAALKCYTGQVSVEFDRISKKIFELRSEIEALIDFSEEEINISISHLLENLKTILDELEPIIESAEKGNKLRRLPTIVLRGRPNVGKSTLFNKLTQKDAAIVTNIPGTTRDIIKDDFVLSGQQFHIFDTAGIRESSDPIEKIGIKKTQDYTKEADIIINVYDPQDLTENLNLEASTYNALEHQKQIYLFNKSDLIQPDHVKHNLKELIFTSEKDKNSLMLIQDAIKKLITPEENEALFLANERQLHCLKQAQKYMLSIFPGIQVDLFAELAKLAHEEICKITGEITTEDVLGQIFSKFCVGK